MKFKIMIIAFTLMASGFISLPFFIEIDVDADNGSELAAYHTYEEMTSMLQDMAEEHSNILNLENLTTTHEENTIWAIKVSDNPKENEIDEPGVLYIAGVEANSLISVETALSFLDHLVENYSSNTEIKNFIDSREIWILPMINPDGCTYVVEHDDEDWIKNRRDNGDGSFGVNLDRNFGTHWGEIDAHTSDLTASQYYYGPGNFSEPETRAIKDFVQTHNIAISLFLKSNGENITYPWGYTSSPSQENLILSEIAEDISLYTDLSPIQSGARYVTHGNADDWLYENASLLPLTMEISLEDIPPSDQIQPISEAYLKPCLYLLDIADNPSEALTSKWTFMVYMSGDNDLEDEGILDINEMEEVGSTPYVNIVVQFDRAIGGHSTNPDWTTTRRYLIRKDDDENTIGSPVIEDLDEVNMASPQVLSQFVNWSMTNYPAEHYFLDLWGHGKGWNGVVLDDGDWLYMDELKSAFMAFDERIDVVGFDNCNMAMLEVYTQIMDFADYVAGSEKEEDAWGWPYDMIFSNLTFTPDMSPRALSSFIAKSYIEWASSSDGSYYSATVSVVDLNILSKIINATSELGVQLNKSLTLFKDEIGNAISDTEEYAKAPHPKDLYHFGELLVSHVHYQPIRILAQKLMESISEVVITNEHWTSPYDIVKVDHAHGISIWLPTNGVTASYRSLDFAIITQWDEFLGNYKNNFPRPDVQFVVEYDLKDGDEDGNNDTIELSCFTNVTGLNINIDVCNSENDYVVSFSQQSTSNEIYIVSFKPYSYSRPADYYNFYFSLLDKNGSPQNYSEILGIWLGNERPDLSIMNLTFYRADNETLADDSGKRPIVGQETSIEAMVVNSGTEEIHDIDVTFLDDDTVINEVSISLSLNQQIQISAVWIPPREGEHTIDVIVDYFNSVKETNETNNKITKFIEAKSVLPLYMFKIRGKVVDNEENNIRGAKITIKNMRTNDTVNVTTDRFGFEKSLDTDWYHEGDLIEVRASYESESSKQTFHIYSEDKEKELTITLDTQDWLNILKMYLVLFEIIGFVLVIKYYFNIRKFKKQRGKNS